MGRFWLGTGLLLVLFGLGLWTCTDMEQKHQPITQAMEQAAEKSLSGDMEAGVELARRAYALWEEGWHSTASVADHTPMDEIDGLFAQTLSYARAGDAANFAAGCARIARLVKAVGEAHGLNWWNLL